MPVRTILLSAVVAAAVSVPIASPASAAGVPPPDAIAFSSAAVALSQSSAATERSVPAHWISRRAALQRPVLRPGMTSSWVREVQRVLRVSPRSGYFGPLTKAAVKRFQKRQGIAVRGLVAGREWRRLGTRISAPVRPRATAPKVVPARDYSGRPTLRKGMTSAWVAAVQRALGVTPVSGYFGDLTEAAVRRFQSAKGLRADGIVGLATWRALGPGIEAAADVPAIDVTQTAAARSSRAHRMTISVAQFTASPTAVKVVTRESGGRCDAVNPNGIYRGKWQMDANFWSYYGGRAFAARPDLARCGQQDLVAYRGWVDRWWQPWPTAY